MASLFIDGASGIGGELGLDEDRDAKHTFENTAPAPTGWFGGAA